MATRKRKAPRKTSRKAAKDEMRALVLEIRSMLRSINARLEPQEAPPPQRSEALKPGALTITPELDAACVALHQSVEELKRTIMEEFGDVDRERSRG